MLISVEHIKHIPHINTHSYDNKDNAVILQAGTQKYFKI